MIDKIIKFSSARIGVFISLVIGLNLLIPAQSLSCPIPVFRFALEYWTTDSYQLEIFHQNSPGPEEEELINYLLNASSENEMNTNLEVSKIDMEGDAGNIPQGLSNDISNAGVPWMVLRYPRISGINEVVWSGPLNNKNVNHMLNSPVRKSIAEKLVGEFTAVWVMLESGNRQKDRAALDLLEKELSRLEQTLELPNPELWWGDSQDIDDENVPGIQFDIIRLSRHDPGEKYLIEMLLNSEDDLKDFDSEPIVFPVYGRGVALYAILGEGINKWNIREAAEFLTGYCSCQAKAGNPGVDLMLSMDWEKHIENLTDLGTSNPLSGMGDFKNKEEEVRRRLDSATFQRLGTGNINYENIDTDPEKVVYLDISGDKKTNIETEKKPAQIRNNLELSDKESIKNSVEEPKDKMNLKQKFILVFTGIILLVLLGGIVLYKKNIK